MRMYDIIMKKRDGGVLSDEEIGFFVDGVVDGSIPDYQSSALLMAIYFRGLNAHETAVLTDRMAHSGDLVDLSAIHGFKADKHSTGGVGDKTTMIVGPIVASCGVPVAKMSGRGLGHTGGTVDKLESIPGFRVELSPEEFVRTVNEVGICVVGQSGNLAPADKKLYALRDVTATVDSIPLIAASIMSKKIAAGADGIVLDVKVGSGAFMKTLDDAVRLAETMVAIGEKVGRKTVALLTNMDAPLGRAVGNALEVREAVETLQGHGPAELTTICRALAANMLFLAGKGDLHHCDQLAREAVLTGAAFERFKMMVTAQGGDPSVLDDPEKLPQARMLHRVRAPKSGYITHIDAEKCGVAAAMLGAGRQKKGDPIDYAAGITFTRELGEQVEESFEFARFYTADESRIPEAERLFLEAVTISEEPLPEMPKLIFGRVSAGGTELI